MKRVEEYGEDEPERASMALLMYIYIYGTVRYTFFSRCQTTCGNLVARIARRRLDGSQRTFGMFPEDVFWSLSVVYYYD
jgi:hypothetical protein